MKPTLITRLRRRALRTGQSLAESVFRVLYREPTDDRLAPPVFILGLPRSGTTLVYQYIVHRKHVSYFTNGVGSSPWSPCLTTYRQHRAHPPYRSDFRSHYGRSSGAMAPREAGAWWLRHFDIDAYQTFEDLPKNVVREIRGVVGCVEAIFGGVPFVNKNVKHLLRIDALARIFPESHFLVVERDRVDVALSVLRGRVEMSGGIEEWFSARPRNYAALAPLAPVDQVAGQVAALEQGIADDLSRLDERRVHSVAYDDFCRRPDCAIESVAVLNELADKNPAVEEFELRSNRAENAVEEELVEKIRRMG